MDVITLKLAEKYVKKYGMSGTKDYNDLDNIPIKTIKLTDNKFKPYLLEETGMYKVVSSSLSILNIGLTGNVGEETEKTIGSFGMNPLYCFVKIMRSTQSDYLSIDVFPITNHLLFYVRILKYKGVWTSENKKIDVLSKNNSEEYTPTKDYHPATKKYVDDSINASTPDWNQNDETAQDYVKNRPFYTGDPVETVFVEESTVSFVESSGLYGAEFLSTFEAAHGETYKVSWDGTVYECTCVNIEGNLVIGNPYIANAGHDTGEPFVMLVNNGEGIVIMTADTSDSHTLSISGIAQEVVKIDEKYLPENLATKSEVEVAQTAADNAQTAADNAQTTADNAQTTADNAQTTADNNKEVLYGAFSSVVTFTFDKQTSGRDTFVFNSFDYYKISDFNPAPEAVTSFKGTRESGLDCSIINAGNNCVEYGLFIVVSSAGDCSIPIEETVTGRFTAPSAGLYAMYKEGNTSMTAGKGEFTLMSIDGLTIKSSTYGSAKKFRITVDDSGTVTATEVT